jgi:hypothetical protein
LATLGADQGSGEKPREKRGGAGLFELLKEIRERVLQILTLPVSGAESQAIAHAVAESKAADSGLLYLPGTGVDLDRCEGAYLDLSGF